MRTTKRSLAFFSFLFNLRHVTPRIPYRVDVLSPEQQQYLLPYFALIGLVYMVLYSLFSRYQKTLDSIPFFYATNLGMDFLSPNSVQGRSLFLLRYLDTSFKLSMRIKSTLKLVVESNFHVYVFGNYEDNRLHIQILSQFIEKRVFFLICNLSKDSSSEYGCFFNNSK